MGFGSSTGGGTNEGFGGNESGIGGGGSSGGGGTSYSEDAMLAAIQAGMRETSYDYGPLDDYGSTDDDAELSNREHGYSALGYDADGIGHKMAEYMAHDPARQARDRKAQEMTNRKRDFSRQGLRDRLASWSAAKEVGMPTGWMGEATVQGAVESLANLIGGKLGSGALGAAFGPLGAAVGDKYGSKAGTWGMDEGMRDFIDNGMATGQYTSVAPDQRTAEMGYQDSQIDERYLDSLMRRITGAEV